MNPLQRDDGVAAVPDGRPEGAGVPVLTDPGLEMPPVYRQVRWRILAMLFFVTMINFIDRQTLSVTAPKLRELFSLTNTHYGIIVAAFQLGMVVGEFPMGWLMDRRGTRIGLSFAVVWWSIANAMHAVANSVVHFSLFRFWLGTGECGNFSGGNKAVAQWFPVRERAFAVGIFNSASMIGSAVAPFLIVPLLHHYGWRVAFLVPSLLGMVWAWIWYAYYRVPDEHKTLTPAEAA
ncbi:MAG: MFS transporter, partial [Vicinamibacterales bacterium]|nr:MFS transporter [Vicinamibacterales bacterium]